MGAVNRRRFSPGNFGHSLYIRKRYAVLAFRVLSGAGYDLFYPALEGPPGQEDASAAAEAPNADIGSQSDHLPVVAAAGVSFSEAYHVAELWIHRSPPGRQLPVDKVAKR